MIETSFDAAVELVVSGPGSHAIRHLLEAAQEVSGAPFAYILVRRGNELQIVATTGAFIVPFGLRLAAPIGISAIFGQARIWEDLTCDPALAHMDMVDRPNGWRWFASVPVPFRSLRYDVALCCADPRLGVDRRDDVVRRLSHIAVGVGDVFGLLGMITTSEDQRPPQANARRQLEEHPSLYPPFFQTPGEASGVTEKFLTSTLIAQHRVLRRGSITYHALARWRSSIREWQIQALRALKAEPPTSLIDRVGSQIASTASEMFGTDTYRLVVPVACGNSGPDCFAFRLAQDVARKLDVEFLHAFDTMPTSGASHPRRNAARPRMQTRAAPSEALLLIDDVATSGAHLEEAVKLLRKTAPAVVPMVWIAA